MTDPFATDTVDPVIEPFLVAHLDYREVLRRMVERLTDDEIEKVSVLFHHQNLRRIPPEFWIVAPRVRAFIKKERERRAAAEGATPA